MCEHTVRYKHGDIRTFSKELNGVSEELNAILAAGILMVGDEPMPLMKARTINALLKKCRSLEFEKGEEEVESEFYGVLNCETKIVYQNTTED